MKGRIIGPAGASAGKARQRGFVLVLVLALLVILSIIATTVATTTQRLRDEQLQRQTELAGDLEMASTRASVMYLLLSQRMTFGGLTVDDRIVLSEDERAGRRSGDATISYMPVGNEIALDGRIYQGLGSTRFALQDDRGRLAVNWMPSDYLQRYLGVGGPDSLPMATLSNLLRDYQDPDDLYRLNSLERDGYEARGLVPPTNRTLVTPLELRRVWGWNDVLPEEDAVLLDTLTTRRSSQLNVNTASARALMALPGIDQGLAERVVQARQVQPFLSLASFVQVVGGVPGSEDVLSLYPSDSGTLKVWSSDGGEVRIVHWTLTPRDDGGRPWREDYEFSLSQLESDVGVAARRPASPVFADAVPASG